MSTSRPPATVRSPLAPGLALSVDPAWLLARRATHAATARQAEQIRRTGTTRWLDRQLAPARIDDRACDRFVARTFPAAVADLPTIMRLTGDKPWEAQASLSRATLWRQLTTRRPLLERVVETWHDHLHIALDSDKVHGWVAGYDRQAIRPHALGRFADLLHASLTHPAMLRYLDNTWSTADHPVENLAREVLELHTVGVGAYTEADVAALSRLLTGFTVDERTGGFVYRPEWHALGPVRIVGFGHANASPGAGPAAVRALAEHLASHPATVRRVCTRLARRFVSDSPPRSLLSRLEVTYRSHRTAIAPVLRTLFTSTEFAASTGQKWARPQEFLAAAYAASSPTYRPPAEKTPWAPLGTYAWIAHGLGHQPLAHPDPEGYPDRNDAWRHPGAMLGIWNAAEAVAGGWDATLTHRGWGRTFGLTTQLTYHQAATRLHVGLHGYVPAAPDRDAVATFLRDSTLRRGVPSATERMSPQAIEWNADEAVRLVLASPYMSLR